MALDGITVFWWNIDIICYRFKTVSPSVVWRNPRVLHSDNIANPLTNFLSYTLGSLAWVVFRVLEHEKQRPIWCIDDKFQKAQFN